MVMLIRDLSNPWMLLGGAERLIVDAAVELTSHGHNVHIFTSHHDKNRCFEETVSGERILIFPKLSFSQNWLHDFYFFYKTASFQNAIYGIVTCQLCISKHCHRCLSSDCIWFFPSPTYILPPSCSMCVSAVHFCCSMCVVFVAVFQCCTCGSSLCSYSTYQVKEIYKGRF